LPPFWKFPSTLPDNLTKISKSGKKLKEIRPKQKRIVKTVTNQKLSMLLKETELLKERRKPTRSTRKKTLNKQY